MFCHLSKESLLSFPCRVKALLRLIIEHLPGRNRWVGIASVREVKTQPHSTVFLAQTILSPTSEGALSFNLPIYWVVRAQAINAYKSRNLQIEWRSWEGNREERWCLSKLQTLFCKVWGLGGWCTSLERLTERRTNMDPLATEKYIFGDWWHRNYPPYLLPQFFPSHHKNSRILVYVLE